MPTMMLHREDMHMRQMYFVQDMIWETLQVAAPEIAAGEVKMSRVLCYVFQRRVEL